jgi:hypothetical protein
MPFDSDLRSFKNFVSLLFIWALPAARAFRSYGTGIKRGPVLRLSIGRYPLLSLTQVYGEELYF